MRNRLIRGYDSIDLNVLFDMVSHNLPNLIDTLDEFSNDQ